MDQSRVRSHGGSAGRVVGSIRPEAGYLRELAQTKDLLQFCREPKGF